MNRREEVIREAQLEQTRWLDIIRYNVQELIDEVKEEPALIKSMGEEPIGISGRLDDLESILRSLDEFRALYYGRDAS